MNYKFNNKEFTFGDLVEFSRKNLVRVTIDYNTEKHAVQLSLMEFMKPTTVSVLINDDELFGGIVLDYYLDYLMWELRGGKAE